MKIKNLLKNVVLIAVVLTAVVNVQAQEIEVTSSEVYMRSKNSYSTLKYYDNGHLFLNLSGSAPNDYAFSINVPSDLSRAFTVRRNWGSPAAFEVWGDGTVKANGIALTSDSTAKEDILELDSQLENLKKLKGVSYKWKDKDESKNKKTYGLLAQDLAKIFPEMVYYG
ncbi:MAG: tail fiber domain-containing protein [Prolixibacteraceae bacterium]|nr:tail fiber domain-containing protein [Prolixibacteraceae bacterium]